MPTVAHWLFVSFFLVFSVQSQLQTLTHKDTNSQVFNVGKFLIRYSNDTNTELTVSHQDNPDTIVWQSKLPFVSIDFIKETNFQRDGTISIKESRDDKWPRCDDQTVLSIQQDAQILSIKGNICLHLQKETPSYAMRFSVHPSSDYQLTVNCQIFGFDQNFVYKPHVVVNYMAVADEGFFGLGEQYTYLNLRGQKVPMLTREKGTGRGLQPITWILDHFYNQGGGSPVSSYMAVPFYFTSTQRSLYFLNTEYIVFDLDSKNTSQIAVQLNTTNVTFSLIARSTFLDIITEYTSYCGRMRPLPKWVSSGAIVGLEGGTDVILKRMEQLKQVVPDMPISGVWFQDWSGLRKFPNRVGLWWNWELDSELYHDWNKLVGYLKKYSTDGVKVLTYINPMLANVSAKQPPSKHNYKQIASDNGYLVREVIDRSGNTREWEGYNSASLIDLSNPNAREFLKGLIKNNMLAYNISGWMADFAESYPLGAVAHDPSYPPPATSHNQYPIDWQTINKEAIAEMGMTDEVLYFCRSGAAKSPGVTSSFWVGDQLVTWDNFDGMKAALTAMLSLGLSGFTLTHSDTGGYVMIKVLMVDYVRTKELFFRWSELSAFTSIYRTHPGTNPSTSWQFYSDNSTLQHYSRFAKVYAALADYREQLMQEAFTLGYPLMRPMFLHYPTDPITYTVHLQYMLGTELLVAPVLDSDTTTIEVYLPHANWTHLWSHRPYFSTGSFVNISAPLDHPGIFYKQPLSPFIATFIEKLKKWNVI